MPINRSFYFIRHGETDWNKEHLCQGSTDNPLNDNGRDQAHKAADLVEPIDVDVIISSHLSRAKETAMIISQKTNTSIVVDPRIAERGLGKLEGAKATKDILDILDNEPLTGMDHPLFTESNVETKPDFIKRIFTAFNEHLTEHEGKKVLFVSHGGVFLSLYKVMLNETLMSDNAVPYLFEKEEDNWKICKL